ncbi:MAG TPA: hypothetical protein VFC31_12950 [Candidatus Limnocylindria bacterium]|nr:hypothetical protein [Candidatus Limnocylindria bacterium]
MKPQMINGRRVIPGRAALKFATPGSVHVDQLMTDFAINYQNLPFVGRQLFPFAPVGKETGKYAVFNADRRAERPRTGLRAPKSRAEVVDWSHSFKTYGCEEYAFAAGVDDRERDNADAPIDPDQRATAAALIAVELAAEVRIAKLVTTAATYAASHKATLAGSDQWSDLAASDPIGDKLTADEALQKDAGVITNTAVIPFAVFNKLRRHSKILDAFKYVRGGVVTHEMLASYFDIDPERLLVPGAVKNTAALGAAAQIAPIWSDSVWFGFVDPGAASALEGITFGKSFRVSQEGQPRLVREFRDDPARTDYKEVSEITDERITAIECGFLYSDVLA